MWKRHERRRLREGHVRHDWPRRTRSSSTGIAGVTTLRCLLVWAHEKNAVTFNVIRKISYTSIEWRLREFSWNYVKLVWIFFFLPDMSAAEIVGRMKQLKYIFHVSGVNAKSRVLERITTVLRGVTVLPLLNDEKFIIANYRTKERRI